MSRERGREMEREREMGKRGGERKRERERDREGGGQGNIYNLCSFCHNVFRKRGGGGSEETNSGMETVKIHIKTIE